MSRFTAKLCAVLSFVAMPIVFSSAPLAVAAESLKLEPSDRVTIIGNTLGERLQYFGHFETLLHATLPHHSLAVRNHGWSADELTLMPRSAKFGSMDDHLARVKTDVILAFFGFNESFAGPEGVAGFKRDLAQFLDARLKHQYNGQSAPRIALISPVAHENLGNPNLPDGRTTNANLELYTQAMAEVARAKRIPFVDLFHPTLELGEDRVPPLTFNGVHLTDDGYRRLAPLLVKGLLGDDVKLASDSAQLDRIRAAVNEKSTQYFYRHRAVNGFYIYGGRSTLTFAPDTSISNADVMARERRILDEMCATRDERIWTLARGGSVSATIDDGGTSPFIEVGTNYGREQKGKEGSLEYLAPELSLGKFKVAEGYAVNCFASEVDFPELANPVQMVIDGRNRVYVTTMPSYPQYKPKTELNDKILILDDTDGDGKADKCTVFAEGLHVPTGIELGDGGVYVAQQPNLLFLKDTDGDDRADVREIVLHGFDSADSHHSISAFTWGPGGGLYFQEGTFHHSQIETPHGPTRLKDAGVFRYEPRTQKLDVFVSYGFANPWGHIFDDWGQNFVADASGGANYYGTAFSGHVDYPRKHATMEQFIQKRMRPTAGCEFVSSRHFPESAQGNFLLNNCIGFLGVLQHKMTEKESGFVGVEIEPLLESTDTNFRPVDLQFGLDGALYVVDWHNVMIGHMQHSLRDPNRDTTRGRIWRVTSKDRPLLAKPKIEGASIAELLELLKTPESRVRYHARRELRARDAADVVAGLEKWMSTLDASDLHARLEALWMYQGVNVVHPPLLKDLLRSDDYRVRAAATRVLCYWRDRVDAPLELLRTQVLDEHPRVRLEAVRAASFFTGDAADAMAVALESLALDQDSYLKYTLNETLNTLDRHVQ